jgi:ubiquinone/menaquinone biosynthesis C-methylase UbiE
METLKMKMPNIAFRIMANIAMPIRNLVMPPSQMFAEIEIHPGDHILDFGCGPGIFTIMAAEKTQNAGKVYALDIHPLAIQMVEKKARKKRMKQIETILSDCDTSIPGETLDLIIFFDVFHLLDNQKEVLTELHRTLKSGARVYLSDHHMKEEHIVSRVKKSGLFILEKKGERVFSFKKV